MQNKFLGAILLSAFVSFTACKRSAPNNEVLSNADTLSNKNDSITSSLKIIKTASMNFKVKKIENASADVNKITLKYGGKLMSHNVNSTIVQTRDLKLSDDSTLRISSIKTSAEIIIKVPSAKLEEFLNEIDKLSVYLVERKLDIKDKSLDYLSDQLKLKSRGQIIGQQKKGKVIIKDPAAVMYLKDDMIDQKIGNMKIEDAVRYSVVDLTFFQSNMINKEIIPNDDPRDYNLSFFKRSKMAFQNGVNLFEEVILTIANLWLVILILVIGWYGIRYYKRRNLKPILNNI